ncbi:co-chaperone GroES [Chitinophagales bacterium]|jgi:chaperonin GroES|nr:co-chaperone GroES [Chitinophagales bacterium]|tara:strand:- start:1838 stop:2128 length:291 start_codon:yes stop_codon:yes gene_type:complete
MNKINIKPIAGSNNRVVVLPTAAEETTVSGIIIPDSAQEKPQKGEVVSVSEEDEKMIKPKVKAGDIVLYGKYSGTEVSIDGKDYLIMRESDIMAIV